MQLTNQSKSIFLFNIFALWHISHSHDYVIEYQNQYGKQSAFRYIQFYGELFLHK